MQIKLNGIYRTRDGRKALVIYVGANNPYSVAVVIRRDQYETIEKYTENGKFDIDRDGCNDLVAEWVEPEAPKKKRKLYAYKEAYTVSFFTDDNLIVKNGLLTRAPEFDLEFK